MIAKDYVAVIGRPGKDDRAAPITVRAHPDAANGLAMRDQARAAAQAQAIQLGGIVKHLRYVRGSRRVE
jgi:hypothetical protein